MRSVNSPDAEPFSATARTASWRKSSRCAHGDCVEVGSPRPALVAVRDTRHHGTGPSLAFTPAAWRSFVAEVKHEGGR
jgi:Domain of unknown function (DUF397)